MSVSSTSSTTSTTSSSTSAANSSASSAYTMFLTLLITELKNQDPLNATDTSQFVSQLIGLASVEQEEAMNSKLDTITSDMSSITNSSGVGYIGKTVEATGSTTTLQSGSATWNYTLDSAASSVTLTIKDSSGSTVDTISGDTASGAHTLSWDGSGSSETYSSGDYTLSVSATDSSGNTVTTSTSIVGTVTAVDSSSGTTELDIGDVAVSLSSILTVSD
jgi:flagellar basal-body rod modification protein FlgD